MNHEKNQLSPSPMESWEAIGLYLWENCHDAVITTDFKFSNISLNPAASALMSRLPGNGATLLKARNLLKHLSERNLFTQGASSIPDINYHNLWFALNVSLTFNGVYFIILKDISEKKSLEKQLGKLKMTNIELNEIIELSADGLVSVDPTGHILRLNKAYKRILGIKGEDFIGKPARMLVEKGYLPELVSPHVLKNHKAKNIVVTVKGKEILLTGRPVFNEHGQLIRVVANIRDLTKLNKLRNELKKYYELANRYETEIHHLRANEIKTKIIGRSTGTLKMISLAAQASKIDSTVLIYGETGTGKEVLAKSIHKLSKRKTGSFIAINCSSVPEALIESELFGYEPGSFTGALKNGKVGLFETAHGGTLFLDEISDMSISMQTKLLRVIQEKRIRRIRANEERQIDIRIITASNKELKDCIETGKFRADLYYRINIINVAIPPLRERKEDIPLLVNHFLDIFNKKFNRQKSISEKEVSMLSKYDWPGNIRELENMIERFVVLNADTFLDGTFFAENITCHGVLPPSITCLKSYLEEQEKYVIWGTYNKCKSTRKTAKALNVSQSTIVRKLIKYK